MNKIKELSKLFWAFLKVGLFAFGGGWAILPLIEKEAVEKNNWIKKDEISDIFVLAESTPGPLSVKVTAFVGYKHMGFWGSVVATVAVTLPTFIITIVVVLAFGFFSGNKWVDGAIKGAQAGAAAILFGVAVKLFGGLEKKIIIFVVLLAAFLLATFVQGSIIFVIIGGGIIGLVWQTIAAKRQADKQSEKSIEAGESEAEEISK